MKFIQKQTDKELKELAINLWSSIYQTECYGVKDYQVYWMTVAELEKRGYSLEANTRLTIKHLEN